MPTNIPKAREILREVWVILKNKDEHYLAEMVAEAGVLMTRKVRVQPRTVSRKITSEIVAQVLYIVDVDDTLTDLEIANHVNINPGRVNEIRNGLRTVESPSMAADGLNRRMAGEGEEQ